MAKKIKEMSTPDLDQTLTAELLGQAVRARRTQSNLRLADAAALCGVAKQTLMKIEHGEATCQLASILQVCAGLGIKLRIQPWRYKDQSDDDWQ